MISGQKSWRTIDNLRKAHKAFEKVPILEKIVLKVVNVRKVREVQEGATCFCDRDDIIFERILSHLKNVGN